MFPTRTIAGDSGSVTVATYRFGDSLLRRGDQIVAVNDRPVDSLLRVFAAEIGGETQRWREQVAARQFETFLLLNDIRAPFTVEVRSSRAAETRRIAVRGIGRDSMAAADRRASAAAASQTTARNFTYRMLPDRVAYMNLFTLGGDLGRFRQDLDSAFRRFRADSARTLIVDVRTNGGGDSRLGDELLSHITSQPYRMESAKLWKMSAEYRAQIKSMVRPPLNHLPIEKVHPIGRRLFSGPAGTIVRFEETAQAHDVREPRFDGPVCVLIGAGSFSSTVDLVDAIKTYNLATLIGEETGGRPNTFGEVYYFRTRATGFLVGVSSASFVRANGDTTDHRGVLPDIEVHRSAEDVRAGRDPVIDRARDCPSRMP
jgi:C-terminal processing protease CtpA/Prc